MKHKGNVIYISHGGGPMPLLGDADHQAMISTLKMLAKKVGKPSAILVISAHWETHFPTVTFAASPTLIYDYVGFPKKAYEIQYPCTGQPELAELVYSKMIKHGINASRDEERGFDHGVFVPLKIMYPEADIPCVQLSLSHHLDANFHIEIGKALADLEWDNLLVIGSGSSFHNIGAFFSPNAEQANINNLQFEHWLTTTVSDPSLSENVREQKLIDWQEAPSGIFCHPRAEHLLPLHVCYGMTGKASDEVYGAEIMNKQSSMFHWER